MLHSELDTTLYRAEVSTSQEVKQKISIFFVQLLIINKMD